MGEGEDWENVHHDGSRGICLFPGHWQQRCQRWWRKLGIEPNVKTMELAVSLPDCL